MGDKQQPMVNKRVLCVAEKPSAARQLVDAVCQGGVNASRRRPGQSQYNHVFEFETSAPIASISTSPNETVTLVFTSVTGHLFEQDFEARYRVWSSCDPSVLLDRSVSSIQCGPPEEKMPLVRTLQDEARDCMALVLWLDGDSEGEKIAADVASVVQETRPNINVRRARFSAITTAEILHSLANLDVLNQRVVAMVAARQEIDLRSGAAFTRLLTGRIQNRFSDSRADASEFKLVSYGPCQFPTLGLVVDRYLTIRNFIRVPFYVIDLGLAAAAPATGVIPFTWDRGRIFDQYVASVLYEACVEDAMAGTPDDVPRAHVTGVRKNQRRRWKPLPLATVELQKEASRKLHLSSHLVMEIAEKLYTSGFISYPRTETDKFSRAIDLRALVAEQSSHAQWGHFATRLLANENRGGHGPGPLPGDYDIVQFDWPRDGPHDDAAHPPIHPTKVAQPGSLSGNEARVYEYVARRFLASCSVDAIGAETVVNAKVGVEPFTAKGLIVEHRGFLDVFHYQRWADTEMPAYRVGQPAVVRSLLLRESSTEPPPLLSESDLISLMDRHGIGTDATIAEHVKKVQDRNYVRKLPGATGRFEPLPLGLALVDGCEAVEVHLARPTERARQEAAMKRIASGEVAQSPMIVDALGAYSALYESLRTHAAEMEAAISNHLSSFSAAEWRTHRVNFSTCGDCGGVAALKYGPTAAGSSRRDRALYCATCAASHILPFHGNLDAHDHVCPICNFQTLTVTNTERNTSHYVCPYCFSHPPQDAADNPTSAESSFRCFTCTHANCALATGSGSNGGAASPSVATCGTCGSAMALRQAAGGSRGWRVACASPNCTVYFFPRCITAVEAAAATCPTPTCQGASLLQLMWTASALPRGQDAMTRGCIWCDRRYAHTLQSIGVDSMPSRGNPRGRGRDRGRGAVAAAGPARGRGRGGGMVGGRGGGGGGLDLEDLGGRPARAVPIRARPVGAAAAAAGAPAPAVGRGGMRFGGLPPLAQFGAAANGRGGGGLGGGGFGGSARGGGGSGSGGGSIRGGLMGSGGGLGSGSSRGGSASGGFGGGSADAWQQPQLNQDSVHLFRAAVLPAGRAPSGGASYTDVGMHFNDRGQGRGYAPRGGRGRGRGGSYRRPRARRRGSRG